MGYQKPLYLTTKRDVFYYTRRVPRHLKAQFQSSRFLKCLHAVIPMSYNFQMFRARQMRLCWGPAFSSFVATWE
ncbi:MAG: hypothetical protein RMX61_08025 [Planktomarina sp.]|nr:hypothetical protein [Planktomarina sp.]